MDVGGLGLGIRRTNSCGMTQNHRFDPKRLKRERFVMVGKRNF